MTQLAELQSRAYYQASLLYGREAGVEAGLYYLGQASGLLDFALFCADLPYPPQAAASTRSVDPEIAKLEQRLMAGFKGVAEADQGKYIRMNSSLKLAGDLNREGRYEGALVAYLQASIVNAPDAAAAEFTARITTSKRDDSIARLFWELAQTQPIAARALPLYFSFVEATPAPVVATSAPAVTITLVRWPYT